MRAGRWGPSPVTMDNDIEEKFFLALASEKQIGATMVSKLRGYCSFVELLRILRAEDLACAECGLGIWTADFLRLPMNGRKRASRIMHAYRAVSAPQSKFLNGSLRD